MAYKYTGKERDDSTGLYFYEARYYDAALGRFISADTIVPSATDPQSLNRYAYARNNPILFTDPSGHSFYKSIKKRLSKDGDFLWKYRHVATGGFTLGIDKIYNSNPYVRAVFVAGGTYAAGPYGYLAAAASTAYATKLDGGSSLQALKAGIISGVAAYVGGEIGNEVGGVAGGLVGAAAGGAISSTLSGGDPGQGALYGAAYGAAGYVAFSAVSLGAQAAYDYYATKDAVVTQQMRMIPSRDVSPENHGHVRLVSSTDPRYSGTIHSPGQAIGNAPGVMVELLQTLGAFTLSSAVDSAFANLANQVPYGQQRWGTVTFQKGNFYPSGSFLGRGVIAKEGGSTRAISRRISGTNLGLRQN